MRWSALSRIVSAATFMFLTGCDSVKERSNPIPAMTLEEARLFENDALDLMFRRTLSQGQAELKRQLDASDNVTVQLHPGYPQQLELVPIMRNARNSISRLTNDPDDLRRKSGIESVLRRLGPWMDDPSQNDSDYWSLVGIAADYLSDFDVAASSIVALDRIRSANGGLESNADVIRRDLERLNSKSAIAEVRQRLNKVAKARSGDVAAMKELAFYYPDTSRLAIAYVRDAAMHGDDDSLLILAVRALQVEEGEYAVRLLWYLARKGDGLAQDMLAYLYQGVPVRGGAWERVDKMGVKLEHHESWRPPSADFRSQVPKWRLTFLRADSGAFSAGSDTGLAMALVMSSVIATGVDIDDQKGNLLISPGPNESLFFRHRDFQTVDANGRFRLDNIDGLLWHQLGIYMGSSDSAVAQTAYYDRGATADPKKRHALMKMAARLGNKYAQQELLKANQSW